MVHEVSCTTSLNLSLGDHDIPRNHILDLRDQDQYLEQLHKKSMTKLDLSLPSLTLGLRQDLGNDNRKPINAYSIQQASNSSISAISSFSNSTSSKRKIEHGGSEEVDKVLLKTISHNIQDELDGGSGKKLRLTKEQSFVLEESFKQHSILIPKQKQNLAKSLNLLPRQVEVWFQNRRARTKLKQNEVDCALLKKCCKALTSDNRRLKMEIQQLKAMKATSTGAPPYYMQTMQLPAATHTVVCPSCERIAFGSGGGSNDTAKASKTSFTRATKSHLHLFSQLC